MSTIRWLGEDDCHHEALVGGKAASLSRLASRHPVPHGFAISAIAAAEHTLVDGLLPAIEHAYHRLGERCGTTHPPVAVRSSALDEDGLDASFAGQHDTYLNIRGVDAVLNAIRRCVMSATSREALAYRQQRGLCADGVQMAVLVQQFVPSDVSAVVFSANPVSGSRDELMINSNWGLGESIVSGTAMPDTFVVRKQGLEVAWRDIAQKDRMTVPTETGTAERDVPPQLRAVPSLTEAQVRDVAQLALTLEGSVGRPVDVECAIARDTLYLLQCRPITTLD
ncbi:MAG: PEP/pyruvate-binding domain-containing protein [Chloroflexota bacterium]|nr:PEP/pyruvate-binding domain-containing protein [Chloroflexota bacterium]